MSAHTPGPWRISDQEGDGKRYIVNGDPDSLGTLIAAIKRHRVGSGDRVPRDDEQAANARLIAAAPEMLLALETFEQDADHVDRTDYTGRDHERLIRNYREIFCALIAKARGLA